MQATIRQSSDYTPHQLIAPRFIDTGGSVAITQTKNKRLTFEEYLTYDDRTNNRYELFDCDLVLINPLTIGHTLIIKFLERKFDAEIERLVLPWIALRDSGVRTGIKSRLPDLSVFTTEQADY